MYSTLHQDSCSSQRQRLFDLLEDDVIRQDVGIRTSFNAVESTELAEFLANVCVIDLPVNDVADDIVRVQSLADMVRRVRQIEQVGLFKQELSITHGDSFSVTHRFQDVIDRFHRNSISRCALMAPILTALS